MAHTLKEFVQDRADKDLASLQCAYWELPTYPGFKASYKQAIMPMQKDDHEYVVVVPAKRVIYASLVALCQAGEALKNIERNDPQTYARLPDFPWDSVKRLRDIVTHMGVYRERSGPNAETLEMARRMDKEFAKLNAFQGDLHLHLKVPGPEPEMFTHLARSMVWHDRLARIADGFAQEDKIAVSGSSRVEAILGEDLGKASRAMPLLILSQAVRFQTNSTMDALDRASNLCKAAYPQLYTSPEFTQFRQMRGHWAHFNDRFEDATRVFDGLEVRKCLKVMDRLRTRFPSESAMREEGDVAPHVAHDYEQVILGKTPLTEEKSQTMDRFVAWVTKNFQGKDRLQEAAIFATGQTLKFPHDQAKEIIDYVHAHKKALNDPKALLDDLPGKSHVLQIGVRDFVDSMQWMMLSVEPKKQGRHAC